jgi:hypothetical protein
VVLLAGSELCCSSLCLPFDAALMFLCDGVGVGGVVEEGVSRVGDEGFRGPEGGGGGVLGAVFAFEAGSGGFSGPGGVVVDRGGRGLLEVVQVFEALAISASLKGSGAPNCIHDV